jgi:hypothetical protein
MTTTSPGPRLAGPRLITLREISLVVSRIKPGDTELEPNVTDPVTRANVARAANTISDFLIDLLYD